MVYGKKPYNFSPPKPYRGNCPIEPTMEKKPGSLSRECELKISKSSYRNVKDVGGKSPQRARFIYSSRLEVPQYFFNLTILFCCHRRPHPSVEEYRMFCKKNGSMNSI